MTASSHNHDEPLLEQLVLSLTKKVDDHYDSMNNKMDVKVDNLEKMMCEELKLLRKDITDKVLSLEEKLNSHDKRAGQNGT